jgi:hypothetical protein
MHAARRQRRDASRAPRTSPAPFPFCGACCFSQRRFDQAIAVLKESLDAAQYAGDDADVDRQVSCIWLVEASLDSGDVDGAQHWLAELTDVPSCVGEEDDDAETVARLQASIDRLVARKHKQG